MDSKERKLNVSIVGTNGVPAAYGGFETLADNLVQQLGNELDFTVYCSKSQKKKHYVESETYCNAKLVYSRWEANGAISLIYDAITFLKAVRKDDVVLYFGPAVGFLIPILRFFGCKKNIIVNHGGLNEWEREKLPVYDRAIAKFMHKCAARYSTYNIADNKLYRDSLYQCFGKDSVVISYGGDHAKRVEVNDKLLAKYPFLNKKYAVSVSRAQTDNNLHVVLEAYSKMPDKLLVLVSNWQVSDYGIKLKEQYCNKYPNIYVLDAIYDPIEINAIRSNAQFYIHSHSRCGTAPSLCEAMSLGLAIISFDVPVNHETTRENALFFKEVDSLVKEVKDVTPEQVAELSNASKKTAEEEFKWSHIADQYLKCIKREI